MQHLRTAVVVLASSLAALLMLVCGGVGGVWAKATAVLEQTHEVHAGDFPIPFALTAAEKNTLRAELRTVNGETDASDPLDGVDLDSIALERAILRGKRLVAALYPCEGCHGADFGGKAMFDNFAMGLAVASNLTSGVGGGVVDWTAADWDRKIRHGVAPDGRTGLMPSADFQKMTDRELSDIVAFVRSLPPVDRTTPPLTLGPVGMALVATNNLPLAARQIHQTERHEVDPPSPEDTIAFGGHIAAVCVSCHRDNFSGGPIAAGPPSWPPASNLTGVRDWTFEQFDAAMRNAVARNGTPLRSPMAEVPVMAALWSETEMRALFGYLVALPAAPTGR